MDIIKVLSEDRKLITYRPSLRVIGQSVTGTILFQQILYWWEKSGRKPFYKFKEPCGHYAYKEGDSWSEELGFSKKEVTTALSKISFKKTQGNKDEKHEKPIEFWVTPDRRTFYQVNIGNLDKLLKGIYVSDHWSLRKVTKGNLDIQETTTKTTTDTQRCDLFLKFWEEYPNQEDQLKTERAFKRLSLEKKNKAIDNIKRLYSRTAVQYVPNPVNYLTGERWNDKGKTAPVKQTKKQDTRSLAETFY